MPPPALSIVGLHKVYSKGVVAIENLSLDIQEGEFLGLLGPNGAGKSTAIHCITGVAQPTSGTIEVFGIDVVKEYREARRLVGLCSQGLNVDILATPRQIINWMGGYFGMGRKERKARADDLIDQFDLGPHENKMFRELSGGLKRRVLWARALVNDPKLLILDEPTAGVDVELRHTLWRHLRDLNQRGCTILLTSHYLEEVEHLCRDVVIIDHGEIVQKGTIGEICGVEGLEKAYLDCVASAGRG